MEAVFFDASVAFKAAVFRFLLGAAQSGEYRAVWSDRVLREARKNLLEKDRRQAAAALEQNIGLVRDPIVASDEAVEASLARTDAGDRHVLAAAAAAGADILVTDNVRHFDPDEASALGVAIMTPDDLALSIAQRNPFALFRHVQRTPPERFGRYLELLTAELPRTMELLGPQLDG